jgi:hypothetical protein
MQPLILEDMLSLGPQTPPLQDVLKQRQESFNNSENLELKQFGFDPQKYTNKTGVQKNGTTRTNAA